MKVLKSAQPFLKPFDHSNFAHADREALKQCTDLGAIESNFKR